MSEVFFITGATGFIGRKLARRLVESGATVRCLARPNSRREELAELGVQFVDGDLMDDDALTRGASGVDGVFHLAGLTRESFRGEFLEVNQYGTYNVAQAVVNANPSRDSRPPLVAVSSLAGAGVGPKVGKRDRDSYSGEIYGDRRLRRETDVHNPLSPYGRSKCGGEFELQELADELPVTVVRPPYVFGEGDLLSLALFKMAKRNGTFVLPGYVDRYYSFVYVDDLVETLIAAYKRGERMKLASLEEASYGVCSGCGVYFATAPKPIKFSEFGAAIGRAYGRDKLKMFRVPPVGVLGTAVYGECYKKIFKRPAPLDWNKALEALRGPWICSGAKAKEQLGVDIEVDLEPKIERAARWYEQAGLI